MDNLGSDDHATPDPPVKIVTSKILYRKEQEAGLRTGKRWLKTRVSKLAQIDLGSSMWAK